MTRRCDSDAAVLGFTEEGVVPVGTREHLDSVLAMHRDYFSRGPAAVSPMVLVFLRPEGLAILDFPAVAVLGGPAAMAAAGRIAAAEGMAAEAAFLVSEAETRDAVTGEDRGRVLATVGGDADGHSFIVTQPLTVSEDGTLSLGEPVLDEGNGETAPTAVAFWEGYLASR